MDPVWLERLQQRQSAPRVAAPAPSDEQLDALFAAALSAPDHGALRPTRFLVMKDAGLERFADACVAEVLASQPQATEVELATARRKALRAPMIIVASCDPVAHPKVPEVEQLASTACAVQLLQLAIDALGFGSVWRTGPWAYSPRMKATLGLPESAAIVAFLYVGTPTTERPPRTLESVTDYWRFY